MSTATTFSGTAGPPARTGRRAYQLKTLSSVKVDKLVSPQQAICNKPRAAVADKSHSDAKALQL